MPLSETIRRHPALGQVLAEDPSLRSVAEALLAHGLGGTFDKYLAGASAACWTGFLQDCRGLDHARIALHRDLLHRQAQVNLRPQDAEPFGMVTLEEQQGRLRLDQARGEESLAEGRWGCVAFAGGAGTRFFSRLHELARALPRPNEVLRQQTFADAEPKGVFPISPVRGLSFFELTVAEALERGVLAGRLPWVLLLTSFVTEARTREYLAGQDFWGFPPEALLAFRQGHEPRLDQAGDLVVADDRGRLVWSGDGHGGVYRALLAEQPGGGSVLARLRADGVTSLVMFNVDNPAAHPFEPARLGFHLREGALFTLSTVRKTDPDEKVGVVMRLKKSGQVEVVEYNVIDAALARTAAPGGGRLLHEAGNTNTSLIQLDAVRDDIAPTLYTGKTVGSRIGEVAASSMEMLSQHLTRHLDPAAVRAYEVPRPDLFMPTKNVTGADSVETTTRALSAVHAARLTAAGATVSERALCDLHPACGMSGATLAARGMGPAWEIQEDARFYLCARAGDSGEAPVGEGKLTLEPGSSFLLEAARPYGEVRIDPARRVALDPGSRSQVRIGAGVRVESGVRVVLRVAAGGRLAISSRKVFAQDVELRVAPGEDIRL
jgi:UDP-N-acetylglucosamine/UDP-N-acetylgalactosamine diphosphorylase